MTKADITRTVRCFRDRLRRDDGISIIEVLAATMIFLILSVGVAQATINAIRLAGDQRHRVTALSLAAGEIDLVRSIGDPFKVLDRDETKVIDDLTYTIYRSTSWVSGTGLDIPCGAGATGTLQYKRVNVRVVWKGQMDPVSPVSTDTILAPDGRLNDPNRGTILVAATRADGTGANGVPVTITPVTSTGAVALDEQPDPTNEEGCSYALQVKPGTYTVSLAKSGFISSDQASTATSTVVVAAGVTVNAPFAYDQAGTFGLTYAGGSSAARPTNFEMSFVNTYGTYYTPGAATAKLFPWSSGYRGIAGHYVAPDANGAGGCPVVDPAEWGAATVGAISLAAPTSDPIAATPGGTASMGIPLGIVRLNSIAQNKFITAVSQNVTVVAGQPTCTVGMTYTFGQVNPGSSSSSNRDIMLPYGSWKLYAAATSGATSGSGTSAIGQSAIVPLTNLLPTGMVTANQVTLDPRVAG